MTDLDALVERIARADAKPAGRDPSRAEQAMTAILHAIRRYRHKRAFRASLVKRTPAITLMCWSGAISRAKRPAGLRRLIERVWG